jgi:hypothetical protein
MAFRLSKKAIVILVVLGLLLLGGVTGYIVWTVYYQDNVAPTDSEAGGDGEGSCTGPEIRDCYKKCSAGNACTKIPCDCGGTVICPAEPGKSCGDSGEKRCQCCDGTWILTRETCSRACRSNGGEAGDCEDEPDEACWCESKANGCGINCTFPAGTQNEVNQRAEGSCEAYIAMCNYNGDGSKTVSIERFTPSHVCWGKQHECKNPVAEDECEVVVPKPPACTSLAMALTPAAQAPTNPIVIPSTGGTITATLTGTDPDSQPGALKICYSIRGKSVEFYKTMTNWVCETKNNAKTMSTTVTHTDMVSAVATATGLTGAQIEAAGIIFMSEVYDNVDGKICTSNPGYATGTTSVIQGTATACGGPCTGSVSFTAAPPACGDGILDPGEECDPGATAGTPANSCTVGTCSTECVCPKLDPGFNIQKVPVQQCIEGKDIYADVRYSIVVTNNGTTVGHMSQVTDDLDPKVQDSWIVRTSITPSSGVTVANGQIIWNLDEASRTFDPGESMTFSYVIRIPQANFGNYRNVVTGIVTDEGEANVTDEAIIDVSCLPGTGLFDSTVARIALAGVLLVTGAYFAQSKRLDGVAFTLFTSAGKVETKRAKFESKI